ncbi:MAG: transcription termination factor Rho [Defluviitaleaceae bacterium]|nr:transcription termination factor Rho [Defluviitaleaceae bacterium]
MNLTGLSLIDLREKAKTLGLKGIGKYRKSELIAALEEMQHTEELSIQPNPPEPITSPVATSLPEATTPPKLAPSPAIVTPPTPSKPALSPEAVVASEPAAPSEPPPQPPVAVSSPIITSQNKSSLHGPEAEGVLEVLPDGYGFLRAFNFLPGSDDIYLSPSQIRRFNLKTGDRVMGSTRIDKDEDKKQSALMYVKQVNGDSPEKATRRPNFEQLTPIYPSQRIRLEYNRRELSTRLIDLLSPVGRGQRGMIVSPPKAGKTVLLKHIANAITQNHPDLHLIVLLIDERPEEVTDMKRSIQGKHCEIVHSTFDEQPEHHKRLTEMVLERAKRLVEQGKDLVILLDSITRLARAYNLTIPPSGRTLSGGLDPSALYMPKKFFGAARNVENGGSLTILATALVDTGSKMDDVIFEEFKGTGNMELVLDRRLSEKRIFPAIDIVKSGTRRDDLLLSEQELNAMYTIREMIGRLPAVELTEQVTDILSKSRDNIEFVRSISGLFKDAGK